MMQQPQLFSKYVHHNGSYLGDTYVEAACTWLVINKEYVGNNIHQNETLLRPLAQELDNLEEIFRNIIVYHELPRRPE